ncbi:MAG: nitrogen regulation protein NR(II) [Tepidisphaerales bacterium]
MSSDVDVREVQPHRSALMIALVYAVVAAAWILLTDRALIWIWPNAGPEFLTKASTAKGWLFVAVTASLLFGLVYARLVALRWSQDELRKSELRFRRLVETASEGIWLIDSAGRTTFMNPEMSRMLGRSEAEIARFEADTLVAREHASVWRELLAAARTAEGKVSRDILFRRADGSDLWAIVSVAATNDGSDPGRLIVVVTDVTTRRDAEERLRWAGQMEAVGRLARSVAHDFNNVLAIIMGYADSIGRYLPEEGEGAQKLGEIQTAAQRGADLVRRLLAFARMPRGERKLINLGRALQQMAPMLRRLVPANVAVELSVSDEPPMVFADVGRLEQIVVNLVLNAADAMPMGGRMRLAAGHTAAGDPQDEASLAGRRSVILQVQDEGTGMDAATQARAFDAFFTTKPDRGTGLGLWVVQGVVADCGGRICIESNLGRGTTVSIWFPAAEHVADRLPAAEPGAASNVREGR